MLNSSSRKPKRKTPLPGNEIAPRVNPNIARGVKFSWIINLLALTVLISWLSIDGYLSRFALNLIPGFGAQSSIRGNFSNVEGLTEQLSTPRQLLGSVLLTIGVISIFGIAYGLAFGTAAQRSTRAYLLALSLITCWTISLTNWNRIIELGKAIRIALESAPLETFAYSTLNQWDELTDENNPPDRSKWTAFNAYPTSKPRMLFFLGEQPIPNTKLKVRSIEYSANQAIRFELSGDQIGNWLELRMDNSAPSDFVGGLDVPFEVIRWKMLRPHLYLVRYR